MQHLPSFPHRRGIPLATLALIGVSMVLCACHHHDGHGGTQEDSPLDAGTLAIDVDSDEVEDPRPDIVLVVADDMRWDLMSGENHPFVDTPNLDAFAAEAGKMTNAFVPLALCSPSRATILTGREPHLASAPVINWRNNSFLQTQRTFAEDLQAAGYTTAYIGKWHLGDGSKPKPGFDHWESFDWLGDFFDPVVHVNGVRREFSGYVDDVLSARADMFLEAHKDSGKPIFLMVGLKAPHLHFEHPPRHDDKFEGVGIPKPDTYDEDFSLSGKLQKVKDWLGMDSFHCGLNCFDDSWDTYIKDHYRAILGLDDSVGTLRAAMRHRGKDDNTLFIYTSDNGYSLGDHGLTEKHMVYEEPIRVPFLIDFPGKADRAFRFDGLVSTLDIAPTALDYAGVAVPPYMTGRSLKPLPGQDTEAAHDTWRDQLFFTYDQWQVAVRTDRFKYIEALNEPGHVELYDLQQDPKETRSVHADAEYASTLKAMRARLQQTIKENSWSARTNYPVKRLLVSQPIPEDEADALARSVSRGTVPDQGRVDGTGLQWSVVDRTATGLALGNDVPEGSSVLIALPLERKVDFDPYVRINLGAPFPSSMYVGGEVYWDNFERRSHNNPNPPLLEAATLVIMRFDGSGTMSIGMGVEAPQDTMTLPLENRHLGDDPERFTAASLASQ